MFSRNIQVKTAINPGTSPDITRMSPVMHECERREAVSYFIT